MVVEIEFKDEVRREGLYYQPYPQPTDVRPLDEGLYIARIEHGEAS